MNITLKQHEIERALTDYIQGLGINAEVNAIDFTAGRGSAGITAEIVVGEGEAATVAEPKKSEPEETKKKAFGKASTKAAKEPEPEKPAKVEPKQEEKTDAPDVDDGEETPEINGEQEKEEAEAGAASEAPVKGKSLFGGK